MKYSPPFTRRVRLDRIGSSTRDTCSREVWLSPNVRCEEGYVLAVRIKTEKASYNVLEEYSGRLVPLRKGDVVAGTLGARRALRGFAGRVPDALAPGDTVHVLNLGGVLGICTSANSDVGSPFEAEVLGAVLVQHEQTYVPAHIERGAIPSAAKLQCRAPIVFVAGTCMDSGKTVAASEIIRGLARQGMRVGAVKLTGVSLRRDALGMQDAGAIAGLTFNDAGVVSSGPGTILGPTRGLLNAMDAQFEPDVIVAELGDGLLGDYGVGDILQAPDIMRNRASIVLCASDPVGAWGAHQLLTARFQTTACVFSGPVTDNAVGCDFISRELTTPAFNARSQADALVGVVAQSLKGFRLSARRATSVRKTKKVKNVVAV